MSPYSQQVIAATLESAKVRDMSVGLELAVYEQAAEIAKLTAERDALTDAARVNFENYEFQRLKADRATATVYQFHYAMKDAGWHPDRTDDSLPDIIRSKGKEMAKLTAERDALRANAERYRWLRDCSMDQRNHFEHYASQALDDAIDVARAQEKQT